MPVTVKFDNTTQCPQQAQIIPDATPTSDGVMTKELVQKINNLVNQVNNLTSFTFKVTDVKVADYDAQPYELVQTNVSGGSFIVTLPPAAGNAGVLVATKDVSGSSTNLFVHPSPGDTVDSSSSHTANGSGFNRVGTIYVSDGISNWIVLADYSVSSA